VRWLRSFTRITYLCKLIGVLSLAACLQPEIYWVNPSSFKLQVRRLRSFTRITYLCKLIGILSLAACPQLEIYWVNPSSFKSQVRWLPATRNFRVIA